jgi:sugar (pentulose or hexulose) kinase
MTSPAFLAFDLGAESGRAVLGRLDDDRLELQEIHRFENQAVRVNEHLHWNVFNLWCGILLGLKAAVEKTGDALASLGVDTWGVDFGLLDAQDTLIGNPYHYRDNRTDGMPQRAYQLISPEKLYEITGVYPMQINSLFQLLSMVGSPPLQAAHTFLNMPDLFNFWLSGVKASEFTITTTSQCYNPRAQAWAVELLETLAIPAHIFGEIVPPGTVLGGLRSGLAGELGCRRIPVVASAGHDTASAVATVPALGRDFLFISSGTWSIMGTLVERPVIEPQNLAFGLTNEGSADGEIRLLKNIMGMWLLQECRREWAEAGNAYSYDDLTRLAESAPRFGAFVLPNHPSFLVPGSMVEKIQAFCANTAQSVPQAEGEVVRAILESLALEYRRVASQIESVLGRNLDVVHIFGGGSRNRLLNQFTANSTGKTVVTGPVEAAAMGNILVQAIATGELASLEEARALVRRSVAVDTYQPAKTAGWEAAYQRFTAISQQETGIA